MTHNKFDGVAPIYDLLAKLVFGESILLAQTCFLGNTCADKRVLIVGGGTGKLLQHQSLQLARSITFLDRSELMLKQAQKRGAWLQNVRYTPEDFFAHSGEYDLVVCNFFLDCFDETHLEKALTQLDRLMTPEATLIVTDFDTPVTTSQKLLVRSMILFFRLFSRLQASKLLPIKKKLSKCFLTLQEENFYGQLVFSRVLVRKDSR
ncbi:class I SAM-dependent methyltransferase [Roseivirga sp. UBA1976]|uniref:class I SAM-dependent methyltransferase n=1 Tax=Roseivirga sp. UBA1976 TaxID=1947386 RepID=UPI00257F6EA4|nr:class I SAM-dependent methyltransferase [Roseivirga sp. UBA1976]|tara:strand:- start:6357 stop:6974 length:618 start_codon:yes stop_codon:yes gene_type:complete